MTTFKQTLSIVLVLAMPLSLPGARDLTAPMDPEVGKQIEGRIGAAAREGKYEVALRELRNSLELYPNEPLMRAPIYLGMSEASAKSGDAKHAEDFRATSEALDPSLKAKLAAGQQTVTRGGKADALAAIVAVGMQTASAILQQRQAYLQQQEQQRLQAAQAAEAARQAQQFQQAAQIQQAQIQQAQQPYYPPTPAGQPGYQPPPNGYAAMPGYAPAPGYAQPPQPQYAPQQYAAPGQPQQPQYAPQQYAPPGQPQQLQYAPAPPNPQGAVQSGYGMPPGQYAPPMAPYGSAYTGPAGAPTRGPNAKPIRVLHDHAQIGDSAYFAKACGALLTSQGNSLVFTPSGGEAPIVIPVSEITEIKLNSLVGKNNGTFHIATKKGLYLSLEPASGDREEARTDIEALKQRLNFVE